MKFLMTSLMICMTLSSNTFGATADFDEPLKPEGTKKNFQKVRSLYKHCQDENIKKEPQLYLPTRAIIMSDLEYLRTKNLLTIEEKQEAYGIARELEAGSLMARLGLELPSLDKPITTVQVRIRIKGLIEKLKRRNNVHVDTTPFQYLPEEIIAKILVYVCGEGNNGYRQISTLLRINRHTNRIMGRAICHLHLFWNDRRKITDEILSTITGTFPNLQSVDLADTQVTIVGLTVLESMLKLWKLDLANTQIINYRPMPHLYMNHDHTRITGGAVIENPPFLRLTILDLWNTEMRDKDLWFLLYCENLTNLNLGLNRFTDAALGNLMSLTNLTSLNLGQNRFTEAALVNLMSLTNLTSLNLQRIPINDAGLTCLMSLTNLTTLDLRGSDYEGFTDSGLMCLGNFPNLTNLLMNSNGITDAGLKKYLQNASKLTSLLLNSSVISDTGLNVSMPNLTTLHLMRNDSIYGMRFTDSVLERLVNFPRLTALHMNVGTLTDAGLVCLEYVAPQLQTLMLYEKITDDGIEHIAKLTNLTTLDIRNRRITDAGLKGIGNLRKLRSLTLQAPDISNEGVRAIAKLTELKTLHLGYNKVTNAGLMYLVNLRNLTKLTLDGIRINNKGLNYLVKNLPFLTYVSLWKTDVTDKAKEALVARKYITII